MTSESSAHRSRRHWPWIAAGVVVALLALGIWVALGLLSAAREAKAQAVVAQEALVRAGDALRDDDVPAARAAVTDGSSAVAAAQETLSSPQVSLVGALPVVGQAVVDARSLVTAGEHATTAAGALADAYAAAQGDDAQPALFSGGAIDEAALTATLAGVVAAQQEVAAAQADLAAVQATLPGTQALAQARDAAAAQLGALAGTLEPLAAAAPALPAALGFDGPRTYLLGILNSAELRASGGPPLAGAVLRFEEGRLTVLERGQTGTVLIPGYPPVEYIGSDGTPRRDRFINATADPDFRSAGVDLARSWEASGKQPVDGVITLDPVALAAVLDATGSLDAEGYGTLDGESFVQAVLVDAYDRFAGNQADRQELNTLMIDQLTKRLSSGAGSLDVLRALGATAPSRNVQVWLADPALQEVVAGTALGGAMADPDPNSDRIAVFSQNTNASKVDAFQERSITSQVDLAADGSATVAEGITVRNDVPDTRRSDKRTSYRTGWSRNTYRVYLPDGANDVQVTLSEGTDGRVVATDASDSRGRRSAVVEAWLPPQGSLTISVEYALAAGTFSGTNGITYRLLADPQALVRQATLNVTVHAPAGMTFTATDTMVPGQTVQGSTAGWSGGFDQPLRVAWSTS